MQGNLLRSTSGRTLNERGLSDGTMPLKKDRVYDVIEQKMGYVVLAVAGRQVVVNKSDVELTPKPQIPASMPENPAALPPTPPPAAEFKPGEIVLLSAKYTLQGNQARNVKNRLAKLIPMGTLTQPVKILVTDALSTAAANQGNVAVITTSGYGVASVQMAPKNILTVEYTYNGEARQQQVTEGSYLILP